MYLSKKALRNHFDPSAYPQETYLLCELQWGASRRFWRHWVRNDKGDDCHVEKYFLEKIFEPRSYNFCDMTWYLSWSPCGKCSKIIQDFLEEQPNVNIDICVARVYKPHIPMNRDGLRELYSLEGVTIQVMEAEDYEYCWDTFIVPDVNYHFSPEKFAPAIARNRSKLEDILQGLHL